jgi:hypothetical protein
MYKLQDVLAIRARGQFEIRISNVSWRLRHQLPITAAVFYKILLIATSSGRTARDPSRDNRAAGRRCDASNGDPRLQGKLSKPRQVNPPRTATSNVTRYYLRV